MITLSWPPKELSPNTHCHWAVKAKAVKSYRNAAGWATKVSGEKVKGDGAILLHVYFYPPSKRHFDEDNLIAMMKSGFDGIADGLGVNDKRFKITQEICPPIKGSKGGQVRIIVTE